ncbi:hypothetical protein T02_4337 [Trichinella nativa]|uniref:Uncharacterized protein n=1 Tax=Trichinella nativa TaxID=6335 RepID=A0A0V1LNL2_9BILA|nr:hypothetical protein T02_4337 [Trichinella nativa]
MTLDDRRLRSVRADVQPRLTGRKLILSFTALTVAEQTAMDFSLVFFSGSTVKDSGEEVGH